MAIDKKRQRERIKLQAKILAVLVVIYIALSYFLAPPTKHANRMSPAETAHSAFERGEKAVEKAQNKTESDQRQAPPEL